jgi:hydroxyacylglutathione hydrolase
MMLKQLNVGYLPTNCYIVACANTGEAVIIDPGIIKGEERQIVGALQEPKLVVKYIINTHGHPDHFSGNRVLKETTGADILIHCADAALLEDPWLGAEDSPAFSVPHQCPVCGKQEMVRLEVIKKKARMISGCGVVVLEADLSPPADRLLMEGDNIAFGQTVLKVIHTPGHTKGGVSLYSANDGILFTGDTLFADSCGRTDLAGGSDQDMMRSLRKLMRLPSKTAVYPGHLSSTTLERARANNPCVRSF